MAPIIRFALWSVVVCSFLICHLTVFICCIDCVYGSDFDIVYEGEYQTCDTVFGGVCLFTCFVVWYSSYMGSMPLMTIRRMMSFKRFHNIKFILRYLGELCYYF